MTVNEGEEWAAEHDFGLREDPAEREQVLEQARSGIEHHRKSPLTLRLLGPDGAALPGRALELEQTGHAFDFGCSAASTVAAEADPAIKARNQLFCKLFNCTTAKCYWDEKWHQPIEHVQGQRVTSTFLAEVDWARANGLRVRGHPLVWTVDKAIPAWVKRYDYERQLRLVEENCRSLIGAAGGRVQLWDLVNEALWEPSLRHLAERDWPHIETTEEMLTYIEPALGWARDEDPDARYVINDYGLEVNNTTMKGVTAAKQRQRFVELAQALVERGCAPDALGTQAHVGKWFPMSAVQQSLDDLASTGLPVQVTEYWAHFKSCPGIDELSEADQREEQARYVRDFYTVVFGHPATDHLTFWGGKEFFDRKGYVPSRLYRALDELINGAWRSQGQYQTDQDGVVSDRVFQGDYRLRWRDRHGRQHSRDLQVAPGASTTLELRLPEC